MSVVRLSSLGLLVLLGLGGLVLRGASSEAAMPKRDAPVAPTPAPMRVACDVPTHRVSELIYGIGYYPLTDREDGYLWDLRPAARRWGGNHTSRYNWKKNAWSTAADWYFRNVDFAGASWKGFLAQNRARRVESAVTLPLLGWVAKDTSSVSFSVARFGPQQATDPNRPDAGNGVAPSGRPLDPGPPSLTSVAEGPEDIAAWVRAMRGEKVALYLLDNEPELWHQTHRDVHPQPVGYDELLERTVRYAGAVRAADPKARIAGPAAWGWPGYFYSAKDQVAGFSTKPDRRAHGDVPLLAWYLRQLRAHEKKTGTRLLDVLDVHFYPQELPKDAADAGTRARRLRSTRALWDATYRDESWIDSEVQLLPRMQRLIGEEYPGLGLMIGEYNFGGEHDISGALALAEALGRFGQQPGLTAAFYWSYPPKGSPAAWAFRAYRNYDGAGAAFPELALRTTAPEETSLFAAKDEHGRVVAIALNLSPLVPREARIQLDGFDPHVVRAYQYVEGGRGLMPREAKVERGEVQMLLPPYSITVLEMRR